ncbi:MAG: NFACT family protein, partial [Chlamydiales bacterium]
MNNQEEELLFEKEKQLLLKSLNKLFKRLLKKKNELERSLLNCKNWAAIQHEGDLIKANLASFKKGTPSIDLWDWETDQLRKIVINPLKTPQEEMALRYKRSKKLQRGIEPLGDQVKIFTQKLQDLENQINELENFNTYEALIDFKITHFPSVPTPAAPPVKTKGVRARKEITSLSETARKLPRIADRKSVHIS